MLKARIVFKEGSIADVGNIETMYIEAIDDDRVIEVREDGRVRISNRQSEDDE